MDAEEKKEDGKSCCTKSFTCCCCACKAIKAIVLLIVGGVIGFFAGRHCGMCPMKSMTAPATTAPASTPAK